MHEAPYQPTDPIRWHLAIAAIFAVLCAIRLAMPSALFFDEVHYLPAVRTLIDLSVAQNMEHPPLGKQLIAAGVLVFGDNAIGWRVPSMVFGVLAVFAGMRALWFVSRSRGSSILAGLLLVTGFPLLVQARIAMLDIFMAGFMMLALWMCAVAVRRPEQARRPLIIAGIALGASMASKWNAIPLAALPGLAFLIARCWQAKWHFLTTNRGWPIGGMTLWEAGLWLGVLPLVTYAAAYWPFLFYTQVPPNVTGLFSLHAYMLDLQQQTLKPHPYQSRWWEWLTNLRGIWYLYEQADGAQRGVLLIGNPLSSLAALPALGWCAWKGWTEKRRDCAAVAILFAVSLGLWILAPKPVQFYYHYLLPHCFAMGALALACGDMWRSGEGLLWHSKRRLLTLGIIGGTAALFVWYYPILTAARLAGEMSFLDYAWISGWQ